LDKEEKLSSETRKHPRGTNEMCQAYALAYVSERLWRNFMYVNLSALYLDVRGNYNIGGKVAMAKGPAQFNLEAKEQYQCLDDEQMEELKSKCQEKSTHD
jgi:hypothetical protein